MLGSRMGNLDTRKQAFRSRVIQHTIMLDIPLGDLDGRTKTSLKGAGRPSQKLRLRRSLYPTLLQ
eukprot:1885516-Pyramimonas_sp.AAC.1